MKSERTFGVEIECNLGNPDRTRTVGYHERIAQTDQAKSLLRRAGLHVNRGGWTVGEDGSSIEVRTPILQGQKGMDELRTGVTALVSVGAEVTAADGLHIHLGAKDFQGNHVACIDLVESWLLHRPKIIKFVNPIREGRGGTRPWTPGQVEHFKKIFKSPGRLDINLDNLAYVDNPHIEIRLHEGTVDFEEMRAWIEFCANFLDRIAAKNPIPVGRDRISLLNSMELPESTKQQLLAKARKRRKEMIDRRR